MLHGNPTWSFLYRDVVRACRTERRCIVPDYPGFGLSERSRSGEQTPPEHARWIQRLIDELDLDEFVLLAHDWGGPIGLNLAVRNPDRVRGLVLTNTWCWEPDWYLGLFSRLWGSRLGHYLCRRHNAFVRWMLPLGIYHRERFTDRVRKAYRRVLDTDERRRGTWVFPRSIRTESDWVESTRDRLPALGGVPVTLVWGMADPAFGWESCLDRWTGLFPQASLTRLPDASHYVPEDRPGALAAALDAPAMP